MSCSKLSSLGKRKSEETPQYADRANNGVIGMIEYMTNLTLRVESFSHIRFSNFAKFLDKHSNDRELFNALKPFFNSERGIKLLMFKNWESRVGYIELSLGIRKFEDHFLTRRQIFSRIAFLKRDHKIT